MPFGRHVGQGRFPCGSAGIANAAAVGQGVDDDAMPGNFHRGSRGDTLHQGVAEQRFFQAVGYALLLKDFCLPGLQIRLALYLFLFGRKLLRRKLLMTGSQDGQRGFIAL